MSRRLALPVAAMTAQGLTLEHEGFEIGPVPPAFVLIGANDYGLVAQP
jgi:hypothetical protein